MQETPAARVMRSYLDAFAERDFARARTFLDDNSFSYVSPLVTFNDADAFIDDISRIGVIMEALEVRRTFVDGPEICVIATIKVRMSELRPIPVVLWVTVTDERITTMHAFFDGREYDALFKE